MLVTLIALACFACLPAPVSDRPTEDRENEFPITPVRLSERLLVFKTGNLFPISNVCALQTGRGIVVVDSSFSYSLAGRIREAIEKEFERRDFAFLINTHHHHDHTNGNQAFADAAIVGHEKCVPGMLKFREAKDRFAANMQAYAQRVESQLEDLAEGAPEREAKKEELAFARTCATDLLGDYRSTLPTITFTDRLTIDMDDITLELYYLGNAHTDNDIIVFVPEEGALFMGDVFREGMLEYYFAGNIDVPRWLRIMDSILGRGVEIRHLVCGHSIPEPWELEVRLDYWRVLWEGAAAAIGAGKTLEDFQAEYLLANKYNGMRGVDAADEESIELHKKNVETVWESARAALDDP